MIIWLTGMSSSGKTTLAKNFIKIDKKNRYKFLNIDGDVIRDLFTEKLGFNVNDRIKQIERIQRFVKIIDQQNCNVVVSALYSNENLMLWNRNNFKNYFQVCLITSMKTLQQRDKKNLYSNETNNVVGIDIDWEPPSLTNLTIETDKEDEGSSALKLFDLVKKKIDNEKN